jgi:uncharacterized damage-inducible protein DinB
MGKPDASEYVPFHETYISKVGDGDIIAILTSQQESTFNFFMNLPADKAGYAYAEDKWTIKQVLGHLIDTERIMAYRMLRFARNDGTDLPGFEQDDYVANSRHNEFNLIDLAAEFKLLRQSNLCLFRSLNEEERKRGGLANGKRVTVYALLYIIAGHELHHIKILKERYL